MIPPSQVISDAISTSRPPSFSFDTFIFFSQLCWYCSSNLLLLLLPLWFGHFFPHDFEFDISLWSLVVEVLLAQCNVQSNWCWMIIKRNCLLNLLGWSNESACRAVHVQLDHPWKSRVLSFLASLEILLVSESLLDLCLLWLFQGLGQKGKTASFCCFLNLCKTCFL